MEIQGITALLFVVGVLGMGYILGMAHAGWLILMKLRQQGKTLTPQLTLINLETDHAKEI